MFGTVKDGTDKKTLQTQIKITNNKKYNYEHITTINSCTSKRKFANHF